MTGQAGAVLYTRAGCPLCFALGRLAARSSRRHRVGLVEVDVDADPALLARYGDKVPVLVLPGGRSIGGREPVRIYVQERVRVGLPEPARTSTGVDSRCHHLGGDEMTEVVKAHSLRSFQCP